MADPVGLLWVGAASAAVMGFAWLALAMEVHWHQVHGTQGPAGTVRKAVRGLGVAGLAVAAVMCLAADRPSMAVLVWVLLLAVSAAAIALALAWQPRLLSVFWPWNTPAREP